jgi:hypothetical protein
MNGQETIGFNGGMWIFLAMFFLLGFIITSTKLSLPDWKSVGFLAAVFMGVVVFSGYPSMANLELQELVKWSNDLDTLSAVCTWQTVESILVLCLALLLIRNRFEKRKRKYVRVLFLLPSFMLILGGYGIQRVIFHTTTRWDFFRLALAASIVFLFAVWITSLAIRKIIRNWEWRLELIVIMSFLQLILAMFLPMMVVGLKASETQWKLDPVSTVLTLSVLVAVTAIGFFFRKLSGVKAR